MTSDKRSNEGIGFGSLPLPDEHPIDRKDGSNNTASDMMSSSQKKTRVVIKAPTTSSDTNSGGGGGGYDDFLGYLQSSTTPGPQSKKQKEEDESSESSDDISWSDIFDGNTATTNETTTNRGESPDFTTFLHSLNRIQETPANRKIKAEKEAEAHEIFLEFWNSEAGSKARLDNNFKVFNNIQKNSPEAIWSEIVAGMQNGEVVEQPFWSSLKTWFGTQPSTAAVVEGKQHEVQPEEITDMSSFEEEIV